MTRPLGMWHTAVRAVQTTLVDLAINATNSLFRRVSYAAVLSAGLCVFSGCDSSSSSQSIETMSSGNAVRHSDPATVAHGQQVYRQNCASCHGDKAQGAPNWRQLGADGFYPAPPLNGTGHEWHHSTAALRDVIKHGSAMGQGNMPAYGDKLSDQDVDAVIEWFQSLWPDAVYGEWYAMEQRSFGRR
jgi:mono/diheme cytochrome c family protein